MRSVIFSLIKAEEIIRSLSCKNPFCAIVKGLRLFKASEEQIPTAILEETTKRVNCHENGNLPLFCIEKDTRSGVLYAPFACAKMVHPTGIVAVLRRKHSGAECYVISVSLRAQRKRAIAEWQSPLNGAPDRGRTCNRQNRNLILYPIALRVQKNQNTTVSVRKRLHLRLYNHITINLL